MKRADLYHPRIFVDQEWAEGYYRRNAKHIHRVGKRLVRLLEQSGFEKGRVLDAGCGFGAVAIEIAKRFPEAEIVGVDLGIPLLELAHSLAEESGVADRTEFYEDDVQELEFESDSFDVVINTFLLHLVEDPVSMLNEIERVARGDGRIMMTDLRRVWLGRVVRKLKTAFTVEEGLALIAKTNLRPGSPSKGTYWWDYRVGV